VGLQRLVDVVQDLHVVGSYRLSIPSLSSTFVMPSSVRLTALDFSSTVKSFSRWSRG
jgi:hypothetical protein